MEIYTIIFSVLACLAILLAFSSRLARFGLFALVLIFGMDAFYSLYFSADYIRFVLDIFVVVMVVSELIKNWSSNKYSVPAFGAITTGAVFVAVGAYSFSQNGSFIYLMLGVTLLLVGVWRYMIKIKT